MRRLKLEVEGLFIILERKKIVRTVFNNKAIHYYNLLQI